MPTFSAARGDFEFVDAHGVTVHYYVWRAADPRGAVQIMHGVGEHALRYEEVAQHLVRAGWTVYADDHLGHGATGLGQHGGDHTKLGRLGPSGVRGAAEAVVQLTGIIRSEAPGLPVVALGHSWGSLMLQAIVDRQASLYDAVVLTGTAYRVPGSMNGGDLKARHAHLGSTGFEWLSRDPAVAEAMAADPLVVDAKVMQLFGWRDTLRLLGRPSKHLEHDVPVLIMVGDDDPLGGEESARRLADAYVDRSGLTDVELVVYQGARHEIFRETNRDEVLDDLTRWLDARVPR
ncbi:alpha-beta hydrolase superfamily lysophospholipase [Frigoribacterium sp. PvP120]|uniref:alpha/beta hydrolase n=1 Tax=unclassified Frigoribacterium TaxID=2627005 RepID=UPI001AE7B4FA|nr:alpha/beta hydrolase [Frigoribacterium sp. PvP121]MBP1240739.1 alpha-beta hydrolase superfamily lysophospholipase [Frigoribacterium sp. PvP121]